MSPSALTGGPSGVANPGAGSDGTASLEGSDGTGRALAVFTCCQQSHPFDERRVLMSDEPTKVGRSVARIRPAPDNAIFDCKVLSRNHAVVWVECDKFYLKDTKSSNGTFVNNQRLSKGSEESPPKEIFSGDIIQFGVDIMENTKKVTHGCIIALVRLFHANGQEANSRSSFEAVPVMQAAPVTSAITTQELYQLQQYLKEAAYREHLLEQKLASLQTLLLSTHEASQNSWQALIDEDRLLSRIELLESQLQIYSKNMSDERLREEVNQLQTEKHRRENQAKEALRKALEEKIEAVQKLADVERSLENTEEECGKLRSECEFATAELQQMAQKQSTAVEDINDLTKRLEEADKKYQDQINRTLMEKSDLESRIAEMSRQDSILTAKMESLQNEHDLAKECLAAMKLRVEKTRDEQISEDRLIIPPTQDVLLDPGSPSEERIMRLASLLKDSQVKIDTYKAKLEDSQYQLEDNQRIITQLQDQLHRAKEDLYNSNNHASTLEEKVRLSEVHMGRLIEEAISDLKVQLNDARRHQQQSDDLCRELRDRIVDLESSLLSVSQAAGLSPPSSPSNSNNVQNDPIPNGHVPLSLSSGATHIVGLSRNATSGSAETLIGEDLESLENSLIKAIQSKEMAEAELTKYKDELDHSHDQQGQSQEEISQLRRQLQNLQNQFTQSQDSVENFREKLSKAEASRRDSNEQLLSFKAQVQESQQMFKSQRIENEHLKEKMQKVQEELAFEKSLRSTSDLDNDNARIVLHRQAARNQAEFAVLKDECAGLRNRILGIEKEMKSSRKENTRLTSENNRLTESNKDLERFKEMLKKAEKNWDNISLKTADSELLSNQLNEAHEQITQLKYERDELQSQLVDGSSMLDPVCACPAPELRYEDLIFRTKTITVCSVVPLLLLFVAFLMAYMPFFSGLTASTIANNVSLDPPEPPAPDL